MPNGALCSPKRLLMLLSLAALRLAVGPIGFGSCLINTSYFDVYQGYKVLTHCHLNRKIRKYDDEPWDFGGIFG
jgi:hypothetical protein